MYADDITIATSSQSGLNEWLKIIEIIRSTIGLEINQSKTTIVSPTNLSSPFIPAKTFKYLGIYFNSDGISDDSSARLEEISQKLERWAPLADNIFQKLSFLKILRPVKAHILLFCE